MVVFYVVVVFSEFAISSFVEYIILPCKLISGFPCIFKDSCMPVKRIVRTRRNVLLVAGSESSSQAYELKRDGERTLCNRFQKNSKGGWVLRRTPPFKTRLARVVRELDELVCSVDYPLGWEFPKSAIGVLDLSDPEECCVSFYALGEFEGGVAFSGSSKDLLRQKKMLAHCELS